jgi:hypothetical protein
MIPTLLELTLYFSINLQLSSWAGRALCYHYVSSKLDSRLRSIDNCCSHYHCRGTESKPFYQITFHLNWFSTPLELTIVVSCTTVRRSRNLYQITFHLKDSRLRSNWRFCFMQRCQAERSRSHTVNSRFFLLTDSRSQLTFVVSCTTVKLSGVEISNESTFS